MDLSRREALHRLTRLVGGVISAPALNALLAGCRAQAPGSDWTPQALSAEQTELVGLLVDRILPTTDTPGARDVGVPAFIDLLLAQWAEPDDRTRFLEGLGALDAEANAAHGTGFRNTSADYQAATLERLDREAASARADDVNPLPFFATLKEWTLVGYYTSEVGATQELQWLAIPGRYDADAPLNEVGRTWA